MSINWAPVGNANNAPDPTSGYGAVAYDYYISQYEVTNAQYAEFLNAIAATDLYGLYNPDMGSDPRGGITRSGVSGGFTYATKPNMDNKPVNYVSWYDAVRFANWLQNGQGSGDTETGAYTLLGGTTTPSNGLSITRNPGATVFLTSEDEWYKAAYHQPAAQGGDTDSYWSYPTANNIPPRSATANAVGDIANPGPEVANSASDFFGDPGADWNGQDGNVTTVGSASPASASFYGTSDQAGNVWEWNESLIVGTDRGLRGGSWADSDIFPMNALFRVNGDPSDETVVLGFRVASLVPEPASVVLLAAGGLVLIRRRG